MRERSTRIQTNITLKRRVVLCISCSATQAKTLPHIFKERHPVSQACLDKNKFMQSCFWIHTLDLQLAGHSGFSLGILGSAGVNATVEAAGLPDLQGTDALVRDLPKLWIISDDHLILQPLDLRLRDKQETFDFLLCN